MMHDRAVFTVHLGWRLLRPELRSFGCECEIAGAAAFECERESLRATGCRGSGTEAAALARADPESVYETVVGAGLAFVMDVLEAE
jgi:hypothetical protein